MRKLPVSGIVACLATVLFLSVLTTAFAFPAVTAGLCPAFYGLKPIGDNTFIERDMSAEKQAELTSVMGRAKSIIRSFYGQYRIHPRILVCSTEQCYQKIGGGQSKGTAILSRIILVSPRGMNPVIISHELCHSEVQRRLGLVQSFKQAIPSWFNEGLAIVVSNDPRYLARKNANQCGMDVNEPLPVKLRQWKSAANADHQLYPKAGCRVSNWMDAHGGAAGVINLIDQVDAGKSFDAVYQ